MELLDFLTMDKERIFTGADAVTDAGAFDRSSDGPEAVPALPQMAVEGIHAGFPSPAQNYMEPCIDLNRELVRHPAATFYGRVVGDSMTDAGVEEGDILVIDRSIEAADGDMCVCFVDGEFTLKYLSFKDPGHLRLIPANDAYPVIEITDASSFSVWGVVTYVIKKVRRK